MYYLYYVNNYKKFKLSKRVGTMPPNLKERKNSWLVCKIAETTAKLPLMTFTYHSVNVIYFTGVHDALDRAHRYRAGICDLQIVSHILHALTYVNSSYVKRILNILLTLLFSATS
jgi:hypothetical protein